MSVKVVKHDCLMVNLSHTSRLGRETSAALPRFFKKCFLHDFSSQYYPGDVLARQYGVRRRELQQLNR